MDELRKRVFNFSKFILEADQGPPPPPPPPLPVYDPKDDAPQWNWTRIYWGLRPEVRPDVPKRGGVAKDDETPDWRGVIRKNVIPTEEITKYDFGQPEYQGYYWFDTPDYADPFKKLWYSLKINTRIGLFVGCTVAITQGMPFGWATNKYLLKRWTGPFILGAMAASVTVITVANLRGKKDDQWNYFAGAMMAAAITGRPGYVKHMNHCFYWGIGAISVKYMNEQNGVLYPVFNNRRRNLGIHGNNAQEGILSGDLPRIHGQYGDPGRDVTRHPL